MRTVVVLMLMAGSCFADETDRLAVVIGALQDEIREKCNYDPGLETGIGTQVRVGRSDFVERSYDMFKANLPKSFSRISKRTFSLRAKKYCKQIPVFTFSCLVDVLMLEPIEAANFEARTDLPYVFFTPHGCGI